MIVRDRPSLLRLFLIVRGSVIVRIYPQLLLLFALSCLVITLHRAYPGSVPAMPSAPFSLLGITLSIFLGFRNNASYDRWWEARKDWGQLLYTMRDFARQTQLLEDLPDGAQPRRELLQLGVGFTHLLVDHLRSANPRGKAAAWLPSALQQQLPASRNAPDLVLRHIGARLAQLRRQGRISDIEYSLLDATVGRMSLVLAACERIRNTPVPFGYTLLMHRTAYLFCFLLPFGFVDSLGWATPFATTLIAYTFFGLDALGEELEEPFHLHPNGLAIAAMADVIEINLREALGETDLPPLPMPVADLLT
ncbi:bestrophin family ion channel [Comamonas sp. w2-DMI]|uniref:bestrophin family protein n=1 Tax=Comamonas sp. w2-DMI TaxID=3126391 RepID=UPI0032E44768